MRLLSVPLIYSLLTVLSLAEENAPRIRIPVQSRIPTPLAMNEEGVLMRSWSMMATDGIRVPLQNYGYFVYTGHVSVGTPARSFNLVFDTGSSDLWLMSTLTNRTRRNFINYFDPTRSSTFLSPGNVDWRVEYGKGSVGGGAGNDTVSLGSATATGQVFAVATRWTDNFEIARQPMDGIFGLAFPFLCQICRKVPGAKPLMQTLVDQHRVEASFSFYLGSDDKSEFIIGAPDTSYAPKGMVDVPVVRTSGPEYGYWLVGLDRIMIGNTQFASFCDSTRPCVGLLDTGTSLIAVPMNMYLPLVSTITSGRSDCAYNNDGDWCCSSSLRGLPRLSFVISGNNFYLEPSQYMFLTSSSQACMLISPLQLPTNEIILGDAFLRYYYTVFHFDAGKPPFVTIALPSTVSTWVTTLGIAIGVIFAIALPLLAVRYKHHRDSLGQAAPAEQMAARSSFVAGGGHRLGSAPIGGGFGHV